MGAFKPCCHLMGFTPSSKAMWGGAPMKKRVVVKTKKVDNFLFLVSFFSKVDLLTE